MAGKAIFFDIDGTLINITRGRPRMTERVRAAIGEAKAAGYLTFIASGRPVPYLDPELTQEGFFDGFVLMNGALVLCQGQRIFDQPLPRQDVEEIVRLSEAQGIEYILEGAEKVFLKKEFRRLLDFYNDIDVDTENFVHDYDLSQLAIYKLEFYSSEEEGGGLFRRFLAWPGLTGLMDPYHKKNLELYAKAITKGTGIAAALRHLGIPRENSYAFGDGLNDIEMMQTVGTGIAMGNAQPEVKTVAKAVVPSVDEDGVAWGIEHLLLGAGD